MTNASKKITVAAIAALTLASASFATVSTAEAKGPGFGWGLGAGLVAGTILGAAAAQPTYGAPVYVSPGYDGPRRVCSVQERYNVYGEYIGTRRICRVVY